MLTVPRLTADDDIVRVETWNRPRRVAADRVKPVLAVGADRGNPLAIRRHPLGRVAEHQADAFLRDRTRRSAGDVHDVQPSGLLRPMPLGL
jgi:hypothetical protein